MRRRRKCFDIAEEEWEKFINNAYVLLAGYFLHFLPFLFVERTLFLHHYLPAFIFKVLLTATTIDHLYYLIGTHRPRNISLYILTCSTITWILFVIYVFKKFIVFSYGTSALTAKDVIKLRWKDTWDFIVHKT
ncbi:Protein O-mannosyltransferase 1 [Camponotus floridanus]|uniref:Protein O-mannosyltransferase 1 n=2 Tax=Camponotus floridanus TaxID=104421 RepID=E2A895_CAMFO|nr:Protein O-mannosyltransferase 1 [Camponotus floridanus]